ncbi:MAG: chemotaxis protein CheW, partial [Spirochaetota bacterium]
SGTLMEYRDTLLPYLDLHAFFQAASPPSDARQVVVVDWDGTRIGLIVDEVVGQQQTVIKSLGALPHRVEGVSGATILGDGSVALILDVPRIVGEAVAEQRSHRGAV